MYQEYSSYETTLSVYCDRSELSAEPIPQEAAKISERILSDQYRIQCDPDGMSRFTYIVGRHGHAFCPALFLCDPETGLVFGEQRLFVLEFCGTTTFSNVTQRAEEYQLPILFAYRKFLSTKECERFCICFLLDRPAQTSAEAWAIRVLLRSIFPESEMSDVDLMKVYIGGNYSIFCNKSIPTITTEMLYEASCKYQNQDHAGGLPMGHCRLDIERKGGFL